MLEPNIRCTSKYSSIHVGVVKIQYEAIMEAFRKKEKQDET
jgi:hypothetical protein